MLLDANEARKVARRLLFNEGDDGADFLYNYEAEPSPAPYPPTGINPAEIERERLEHDEHLLMCALLSVQAETLQWALPAMRDDSYNYSRLKLAAEGTRSAIDAARKEAERG